MLRFLPDEHISPDVAEGMRRKARRIDVLSFAEWQNGALLNATDEVILEEAARNGLALVTYDRRTTPPVLKRWAEQGKEHGGVIFVDRETIPSSDIGGLIAGLHTLWRETADWDWTN